MLKVNANVYLENVKLCSNQIDAFGAKRNRQSFNYFLNGIAKEKIFGNREERLVLSGLCKRFNTIKFCFPNQDRKAEPAL